MSLDTIAARMAGGRYEQTLPQMLAERMRAQAYWVRAGVARSQIETPQPLIAPVEKPADIRSINMRLPLNGQPALAHEITTR